MDQNGKKIQETSLRGININAYIAIDCVSVDMQGMQSHMTHEDIDITLRKGKMREEFFLIPVKLLMRSHHAGAQPGLADLRFQFAIRQNP